MSDLFIICYFSISINFTLPSGLC